MPVTIKVNGENNSLVHKGSGHFSKATIPDVCKTPTPGGPVPIPYPNISFSSSLSKGTKTVKADGGNMIAIKGSEFSMSTGDEPGTVGGVKSNTFKKESTWITYSFSVKMEGKNACRLEDKKFQNHENTVDIMGAGGPPVTVEDLIKELKEIACECQELSKPSSVPASPKERQEACQKLIDERGKCVTQKLKDREKDGIWANARFPAPEGLINPKTKAQVTRLVPDVVWTAAGSCPGNMISKGKLARARKAGMSPGSVKKVLDFKFPCPPALVDPYPDANAATLGFGVDPGAGNKESTYYRDICDPPSDVETIAPNAEDC